MARLWLEKLGSPLTEAMGAEDVARNRVSLEGLNESVREAIDTAKDGWGESYRERVHAKGKWTTWERIDALMGGLRKAGRKGGLQAAQYHTVSDHGLLAMQYPHMCLRSHPDTGC